MTNQTLWACPTCLRAATEVRDAVPRCREAGNNANGRCLYQTQQAAIRAAFTPPAPTPAPVSVRAVPERPVPARAEASTPLEQELAKEKEARLALREQLRTTEAVAAESKALRARMTDEMARMNAELARLRASAAEGGTATGEGMDDPVSAPMPMPTPVMITVPMAFDTAPQSPVPPLAPPPLAPPSFAPRRSRRLGLVLGLLVVLAIGAGGVFWLAPPGAAMDLVAGLFSSPEPSRASPSHKTLTADAVDASLAAAAAALAASPAPSVPAATPEVPVASGAVALAPVSADAMLAAQPPAAAPPAASVAQAVPAVPDMPARLRTALNAEGITAPVNVDARIGLVAVSDPTSDASTRERTDTIIRAVFAGANLPEPAIEHRWLSPTRLQQLAAAAAAASAPSAQFASAAAAKARTPWPRRAAVPSDEAHHGAPAAPAALAAADDEPPLSLPLGRVGAACRAGLVNVGPMRRKPALGACMKNGCCNPANRSTEECQSYARSASLTCSAG